MLGQAKLVAQMRAQSIMRGELVGNLLGKIGGQSAILVNRYKLQPLGPGLVLQLPGFLGPLRLLAIGLRTDRDIFIDIAPATSPANAVSKIVSCEVAAAATPTTRLAVETIPSLAPNTAARSQPTRSSRCFSLCTIAKMDSYLFKYSSFRPGRFQTDISMHPSYRPRRSRYWW